MGKEINPAVMDGSLGRGQGPEGCVVSRNVLAFG